MLGLDEEDEEEVKWVNEYSSMHDILLVGEGDFSFSLSLANSFASASNIVATSLDPYDAVVKKYKNAKSNLEKLKTMGASIMHEVDATKMRLNSDLKIRKFDRVVFNFPHAGFKGKEDSKKLIKLHQNLVLGFFKGASHMLRPYGEVHVSHKTSKPFSNWNLEELASKSSLCLKEMVEFKIEDFPGYNNKRGDGQRCDESFPLGECSTFKFRIGKTKKMARANAEIHQEIPAMFIDGRFPDVGIFYRRNTPTFDYGCHLNCCTGPSFAPWRNSTNMDISYRGNIPTFESGFPSNCFTRPSSVPWSDYMNEGIFNGGIISTFENACTSNCFTGPSPAPWTNSTASNNVGIFYGGNIHEFVNRHALNRTTGTNCAPRSISAPNAMTNGAFTNHPLAAGRALGYFERMHEALIKSKSGSIGYGYLLPPGEADLLRKASLQRIAHPLFDLPGSWER